MISKIPEVAAMQREVPEGHCFACEEPLKGGAGVYCYTYECSTAYFRLANTARRRERYARGLVASGKAPVKPHSPNPIIQKLIEQTATGCCIYCNEPLVQDRRRFRFKCSQPSCTTAHNRAHMLRRMGRAA